jgi:HPt (histidine-containing phosphotransfer) domain-containing protein
MTPRELYALIEGDYDKAMQVLSIEKLLDKHIRKLPENSIFSDLENAGKTMDETALFESTHAIKGVCSNLGLVKLSEMASVICEEFRPGNERKLSDDEVKKTLEGIFELYNKTAAAIKEYEQTA